MSADETVTGLDLRNPDMSHYAAIGSSGRAVSIRWPGVPHVEVQVRPCGEDRQEDADTIAVMITNDLGRVGELRVACSERMAAASLRRQRAEEAVEFLTSPRQRFFGEPVVRPAKGDEWSGEVWLLDRTKGFAGFGLRFHSLSALWQEMPDLRPTAAGSDDTGPWIRVRSQQITRAESVRLDGDR